LIHSQSKYSFDLAPKAGHATFSFSERSDNFFYSVVAVPRSAVPFTLKTTEFNLPVLQQSALL